MKNKTKQKKEKKQTNKEIKKKMGEHVMIK